MSGHGKNEKIVLIISGFLYKSRFSFYQRNVVYGIRKEGLIKGPLSRTRRRGGSL